MWVRRGVDGARRVGGGDGPSDATIPDGRVKGRKLGEK